jgi:hypothetical protein
MSQLLPLFAPKMTMSADIHEKDFNEKQDGGPHRLSASDSRDTTLNRIRTAGSISISPEFFEKMYMSSQNVKEEVKRTFGNPTPL